MALVDLKSNLNKFRSEFKPDNPYEKSGREINELQSTVSSEGKSSLLDNVDTTAGTFIKGLKKFGIVSVPLEDNYENSIKQGSIFYANPVASALTDVATGFETIRKAVKNFDNNPINAIAKGLSVSEDVKLAKYQAKAYGKVKTLGEQGSRVLGVNPSVSRAFEGPIKGDRSSKNVDKINITPYGEDKSNKDIIPFKFYDVYNEKHITFRAILTGITYNVTTEYNTERYIGRSENVHSYQGASRQVSFTFDVFPKTRQELPVLWEKINYLYGMCYPNYIDAYGGQAMVSPLTTLTIGNLYTDTPGYVSSVSLSIPNESTWEIEDNLQLPHYCQIAVEYVYIGKYLPNAIGKHWELNWLNESNGINGTLTDNKANVNRTDEYSWIDKKSIREELKGAVSDWWKSLGSDIGEEPTSENTNE
jgi:hypothetical protein